MKTMTLPVDRHDTEAAYLQYRSLSLLAVASFGLVIFSLLAFLFPVLLIVPALGLICGLMAVRAIRRRPEELAGIGLAWAGLIGCLVILVSGASLTSYTYITEVPAGYTRVSFNELQPDSTRPDLPVSAQALELNGKRVFVKGYIYPDERGAQLRQFVMVPDMGTCCFGGQPKLTDMIEVTLQEPLRTRYSYQRQKVGGVLKVDTRLKPISGLEGVYYRLEADYMNGKFAE